MSADRRQVAEFFEQLLGTRSQEELAGRLAPRSDPPPPKVPGGTTYGADPNAIDVVYIKDDDTDEGVIAGGVWFDEDEDGIRDSGEDAVEGIVVRATCTNCIRNGCARFGRSAGRH